MKMEQRVAMNNHLGANIHEVKQGRVSINDIKWDLIRIIEPYDGVLDTSGKSERQIRGLFNSYLNDLKIVNLIQDYTVFSSIRDTAITYDVAIKVNAERSAKKLKIHVGVFQKPWVSKGAA